MSERTARCLQAASLWPQVLVALALFATTLHAFAAERAPLTQGVDIISAPGIGRVALVFLLTCALAVAAILVLRRYLPKVSSTLLASGQMKVVDRTMLLGGTRVHLLEIGEHRIVIADGRNGLALSVLSKTTDHHEQ